VSARVDLASRVTKYQHDHDCLLTRHTWTTQVHKGSCAQKCSGCGEAVVRLGPTRTECMAVEVCIALPSLCRGCAYRITGGTDAANWVPPRNVEAMRILLGPTVETKRRGAVVDMKLAQPASTDRPCRLSAAMVKTAALNLLKRKAKGSFDRVERWIGDLKEGLYPGESSIFRLGDGTVALKTNTDGVISKKPVCGEPFREADGTQSIYDYGVKRVVRE
jgi:hypothetical protein